jgi:hypothetical protein
MSKSNPILQSIKNQPLAWLVQIIGIIFFLGNIYLSTQLFPVIRNIDSIVSRVNALEEISEDNIPYIVDYIEFKTSTASDLNDVVEDLKEIKADLKALSRVHGL